MIQDPASPLASLRGFVGRRWPERLRSVRGADPRAIARLVELIPVTLPLQYVRFLQEAGGELPAFGMFKVCAMTVDCMVRHHEDPPRGASPPGHFVVGVSRDPLGADFMILAEQPGEAPYELSVYFHCTGSELEPVMLVSQYFEDCVALELFDALVGVPCRHRIEWTTPFGVTTSQQFEAEDPAQPVGDAIAALGLLRINANPRCAMYSDGGDRHLTYRTISDTSYFEIQAACHTAEQLVELRAAIEQRLQLPLLAETAA